MSAAMKFARHSSFPPQNASLLPSGWFWKMTVREWAFAQLDVVDDVPIPDKFTGETNNMSVVREVSAKSASLKKVTIRFYAHSRGAAYVYLHDPAVADHFASVEKMLMQVTVEPRSANQESETSLTRLEGTTAVINAPDAKSYEMSKTETYSAKNPLELFKTIPNGTNHLVISSHGIEVGGNICMFPGGSSSPSQRLGLDNVAEVFATLKTKAAPDNCVVWLGGCNIGQNNEFCKKAARASGCPVIAAGQFLSAKKFDKDHVDILDRHSAPKLFLPGEDKPASLSDFCAKQEKYKFVVPV
jgi:hypothetical protein